LYLYSSTLPINSISSGSFPGSPTISTSKVISASGGILGLPADAGLCELDQEGKKIRSEGMI
jgi:hypothetical protein